MEKLSVREVVIVEGRYDAGVVAGVIDGLIVTTDGFGVFSNEEKKELIRRLGARRGLLILTDSDAAGFKIRNYIQKIAGDCRILNAYIPALQGKEHRKSAPSKEGTLGVEGLSPRIILDALQNAGVCAAQSPDPKQRITPTDLYELGLSGTGGSAQRRREFLQSIGLPPRLSKTAMCEVLSCLYGRTAVYEKLSCPLPNFEEATQKTLPSKAPFTQPKSDDTPKTHAHTNTNAVPQKPMLFWDFHGTLTHPDINWFDAAIDAAAEVIPGYVLTIETLTRYFGGTCLPWFSVADRDTRHLLGEGAWWRYCNEQFCAMFLQCGFAPEHALLIASKMREKILQPHRYTLYDDALPTLKELCRRGYQSHILSNNFPELEQIVTALGMRPYMGQVLVSGLIGYEKPRAEIFALAKSLSQKEQPVWMIGDNPRDDIQGAAQHGFVTVCPHGVPAEHAHHNIQNLGDILELLP